MEFNVIVEPFNSYFTNLSKWDGIDYISMLSKYIDIQDDNACFLIQLKKMFVRSVAGALDINYANTWAFILVHQDIENEVSAFLKWICPVRLTDYYAEKNKLDKKGLVTLAENFIINLKDLSTYSRADIDRINTHRKVHYIGLKHPLDNAYTNYKKVANIIGSTTSIDFLKRYEESVGWICYRVKNINHSYKKYIDQDKLWSQAYYLFKNGYNYNPDKANFKTEVHLLSYAQSV